MRPAASLCTPVDQHGATEKRGTDFASHTLRLFLELCKVREWSCFVLFVDLVKAFDRAVREIAIGWPEDVHDPISYLTSLGLSRDQAEAIACTIADCGSTFERVGMDSKALAMLRNLHSSSWVGYGDRSRVIQTKLGGRQGCVFGSVIFNGTYSVGLEAVRRIVAKAGCVLYLPDCRGNFLNGGGDDTPAGWDTLDGKCNAAFDAAFVDDEVLMLAAPSATKLAAPIDFTLAAVCNIFHALRFQVNWKPNKTECFVQFRGKGAAQRLNERRNANGDVVFRIPGSNLEVRAVRSYKHLGGVAQDDGGVGLEARNRRQMAMSAYAPLSKRIFGCGQLRLEVRSQLFNSLVMSRLLYNVYTIATTPAFLRQLNDVYMRGMRMMRDCSRFDDTAESDLCFRLRFRLPSIDCLIARARLRYLGRLVRHLPQTVVSLLAVVTKGKRLSWVVKVLQDLAACRALITICSRLPSPYDDTNAWFEFIAEDAARWSHVVSMLHYSHSALDREKIDTETDALTYGCSVCHASFASAKARDQHRRAKHGVKQEQRFFAKTDGVCPICDAKLCTRLRLLAHLSDRRRTRCWDEIQKSPADFRLDGDTVEMLDAADRRERTLARRAGHSHVLAKGQSYLGDGKVAGRVRS